MQSRVENPISFELHLPRRSEAVISTPFTLEELGVTSRLDRLSLGREPIVMAKMKSPQGGTIYLAAIHHPFLGEHFAQLLNIVVPGTKATARDILDDLRLPEQSEGIKKDHEKYNLPPIDTPDLHERHLQDPVIGELYADFDVQGNRVAWIRALEHGHYNNSFSCFDSIRAFDSTNPHRLFEANRDGTIFTDIVDRNLYFLPEPRRAELAKKVLDSMTIEEQAKFATRFFINHGAILADPEHNTFQKSWEGGGMEFKARDGETFIIQSSSGLVIQVRLLDAHTNQWRIDSYTFPPKYYEIGLFPLVAWEREEERRFLKQQEVYSILRHSLGIRKDLRDRLDTKAGEVFTALFSPDAIETWKENLPQNDYLQDKPERHQNIMGGQAAVWVSHPANSPLLLSDNNPILPVLETVI